MNGLSIRLIICSPQNRHSAARMFSISFLILSRCDIFAPPLTLAVSIWLVTGTFKLKVWSSFCFNFDKRKMWSLPVQKNWFKFCMTIKCVDVDLLKCSIIWCSRQSWWNLWPQGNIKNGFTNKYPEQIAHSSWPSMTIDRFRNVCKSFRTRSADFADSSISMRCSWIFALYS